MPTVEDLELKVSDLEFQMAQVVEVSSRHGQEHTDEGRDPMLGLNQLRSVATTALLPATSDTPTIYYVTGPPLQLFLIDSTGQRELGYSEEQRLTGGDFTPNTASLGAQSIVPGCSITLPVAGSYVVIGNFQFENDAAVINQATGALFLDGVQQDGTVRETLQATTGVQTQGSRLWRVTTSAADQVVQLRAAGLLLNLPAISGAVGDTSIIASGFLGGSQSATSHQHAHSELTSVASGDHHTKYTDVEARDAVPSRIYQAF